MIISIPSKFMELCNGKINIIGYCERCGKKHETTSNLCIHFVEFSTTAGAEPVVSEKADVKDHVDEVFAGLSDLIEDSELFWWYKEQIVQTVLHFELKSRNDIIDKLLKEYEGYPGVIIIPLHELESLKNKAP